MNSSGHSLAGLADFPEGGAELRAQALWGACKNSLVYAYDTEEEAALITLVGKATRMALTLDRQDQGRCHSGN